MTATNSPAVTRGRRNRRGLIDAQCWRDAWNDALTTAGVLGCAPVAWLVLRGIAVATRPIGLLLYTLSTGGHL